MEICIDSPSEKLEEVTFEEIYLKNRKLMMYTAMKILNNHADAEDCVSEAFLRVSKIFKKISDNAKKDSFI